MAFTLATLNTWKGDGDYARRLPAMGRALAVVRPDVACLQEVLRVPDGAADTAADTAAALAAATGLAAHVIDARRKRRMIGGRMVDSASGLALLGPAGVASRRLDLPADAVRDGERLAQVAALDTPCGPLTVVNLHLTHPPEDGPLRAAEVAVILEHLEQTGVDRAVLAGDFNDPLDSPALRLAFTRPGWRCRDAVADAGVGRFPTAPEGDAAIDHILLLERNTLPPLHLMAAGAVGAVADADNGVRPSDHVGLWARFAPAP